MNISMLFAFWEKKTRKLRSYDWTNIFISYDVNVTAPGRYNAGVASAQCQYAPQIAAHSSGTLLEVK